MAIHSRTKDSQSVVLGAAFLSAQIIAAMSADMAPLDRAPIAPAFNWTGRLPRRGHRRRMVRHPGEWPGKAMPAAPSEAFTQNTTGNLPRRVVTRYLESR